MPMSFTIPRRTRKLSWQQKPSSSILRPKMFIMRIRNVKTNKQTKSSPKAILPIPDSLMTFPFFTAILTSWKPLQLFCLKMSCSKRCFLDSF